MCIVVFNPVCIEASGTLLSYGCWCGSNRLTGTPNHNKTVDRFDELCNNHDWCYNRILQDDCNGYWSQYSYYFEKQNISFPGASHPPYNKVTVRELCNGTSFTLRRT